MSKTECKKTTPTRESRLISMITSEQEAIRNQSLDSVCSGATLEELLAECECLQRFWPQAKNLYQRVRALFFLSAIHRYFIPRHLGPSYTALVPFDAYQQLLGRRYVEATDRLLAEQRGRGCSEGLSSALAEAYHGLGFQTLANQVRRSVRTVRGNQWMFRVGHPADHPIRIQSQLTERDELTGAFPLIAEKTAVRMDFSHSGWSDIFFLGMDFPDGARVINASIDLGVHGRDPRPVPPIETYLRVIDEPVIRLTSVDLGVTADVTTIPAMFDFGRDYLGLIKAAVIAAGIVPAGLEGCEHGIEEVLARMVGPGLGLEIVSKVNDIPKGSRLAVSTNLLGSLISICMRATGQVQSLAGGLTEADRRIVAARAILGEWIGGSGGGWQDSGGVWPGIKRIAGARASEDDPEFGISRGRLLPQHHVLDEQEASQETRQKLQESLVLVHGGMAQNVGPILEMVTEKYLLRSPEAWEARLDAMRILDDILEALAKGDIRRVGQLTHRNFYEPLQRIIPWCTNLYTNRLVELAEAKFGDDFWGFWMLGGMAGGGMGFIFEPSVKGAAQSWLQETMRATKKELEHSLPFAMEPVVYDFEINDRGSWADLLEGEHARLPDLYYAMMVPVWLRADKREMSETTKRELRLIGNQCRDEQMSSGAVRGLLRRILPQDEAASSDEKSLDAILVELGFDRELHEQIQAELRNGRIGLSQNRLPRTTKITDVTPDDVVDLRETVDSKLTQIGSDAIRAGKVGVISLAAGVGSRWTEGAGVVKALHPFCQFGGRHRSFLEVHLAKSRQVGRMFKTSIPHVFTTGHSTHAPLETFLAGSAALKQEGRVLLSPGRSVGLRTIPMVRDLRFAWEEMPQQVLDAQQQKMRESVRTALMNWARESGEGSDYIANAPMQCLHPVGHWYEFPNMLRNGILQKMLAEQPQLTYLMLHNIDTVGATVDPLPLGAHIQAANGLSFEVISRRLDDRGGGLAKVDGKTRLLEGLAMPREQDEFQLSFYNSMTTWIDIDELLAVFGLDRSRLEDQAFVDAAVRKLSQRMPTYITIKDVKKRWGHGQEDIFPVTQFEKLWSDMSALDEMECGFFVVPLMRGQQLKEQAQLDGWLRDGSAAYVDNLCEWLD
jgi:hypothetical protein